MTLLAAAPRLALLLAVAGLLPAPARAGNFPTHQGESGLLDVPDSQLMPARTALVGFEWGADRAEGTADHYGPLPLSLGVGLGNLAEWGVSVRESGFPGDPRPAPMLFGTALKIGLLRPDRLRPGVAVDGYFDRFNDSGAGGGRLILSTGELGLFRFAGFAGYEKQVGAASGVTAGLAGVLRTQGGVEAILEGLVTPRGSLAGAALRYDLTERIGLALLGSYLPDDKEFRVAIGVGFRAAPVRRVAPVVAAPVAARAEAAEAGPALAFGDRPQFKLRIRAADPGTPGEPRHEQHGPYTPPSLALATGKPAAQPRAALGPDDVALAQLRDQDLLVEARLKRLRATDESLGGDEATLEADARLLDQRERDLAAREQQLDARERRAAVRGAPTSRERQLEAQEAQLGAAERQLAAQERGFGPTRDAALGVEKDGQAREQAERVESDRLTTLADAEKSKAQKLELRRQALAARTRMAAALEARLVARGERIDAGGRQLRTRGERLDTWSRRLDVKAERIDLLEKRAADQKAAAAAESAAQASPKDKSVFVMVVKSPTAIMKDTGAAPAAAPQRETIHPGVAVEKAVAAATVVTFASPTSKLSELDRETIDGIARLAARENCEVLVWARAKDPSLMGEATRRAEEIRAMVASVGNLPPRQVVTRVTTRPGSQGVDVVVSALRESGRTGGGAEPAPGTVPLASGESGKRQIRDAVVAVQPAIERCVTDQMTRRGLVRAEGSLKLTISAAGRLVGAAASGGDLGGGELEECLRAGSGSWQFPSASTEYVVDVPITVVGGGAKK